MEGLRPRTLPFIQNGLGILIKTGSLGPYGMNPSRPLLQPSMPTRSWYDLVTQRRLWKQHGQCRGLPIETWQPTLTAI